MSGAPWTEAEDEWLRVFYPLFSNRELERMKAEDGWPRSANSIGQRAQKLGISKDPEAGYRREMPRRLWTPERDRWFRSYVPGHSEAEISAEHERVFGFPLTEGQIGNRKTALGIKSGTRGGQFRPGQEPHNKGKTWDEMGISEESRERMRATQYHKGDKPHNTQELLTVREGRDGYLQIKVDPRNAKHTMAFWIPLSHFVWMQANGRDWPEDHRCVFADHDNRNFDPDNLVPVPNDLYPIVQGAVHGQVPYHDRDTLEVAIASARVSKARYRLVEAARRNRIERRETQGAEDR